MSSTSRHSSEHHSHNDSSAAVISNSVLSFFLAVFLFAELVLVAVFVTFFWKTGFLSVLDDDYYQYTYNYLNDRAMYYTLPTGYNESVTEGVYVLSDVHADVDGYIKAAFSGTTYEPPDTGIRERVIQNVSDSYAADGVAFDAQAQEYAATYADELLEIYKDGVQMPAVQQFGSLYAKYKPVMLIAMLASLVLIVVLQVSLVTTHHFKHRGLRYVAYATGGAFLMSALAPGVLYISGAYRGLGLNPQFFYHFGVSVIERLIFICLIGSIVYLVLTIVIALQVNKMRNRLVKSRSRVI